MLSYIKKSKNAKSTEIGSAAESIAENYLTGQGLSLVTRNFRCRRGEIDLVMLDGDVIVFVEVRFRKHNRFGTGADSVNYHKQQKLLITAQHFLQQNKIYRNRNCRFDVLSLSVSKHASQNADIDWIKNAFEA